VDLSARHLTFVLALALFAPAGVDAQTEGRVAVGADISSKGGADRLASGHTDMGFLFRIGQAKPGWGWKYGLNWYATDLEQTLGGTEQAFGELKVRPLMGGYGYSRVAGPVQVSANLLAGYAFASFEVQPSYDEIYRRTLGVQSIHLDVSNPWVLKPEISTWINISRKIGLNVSTGYVIARPTVTVSSVRGVDTQHIRADMFILKVGAVYSVF
jgi:hypothetical protein